MHRRNRKPSARAWRASLAHVDGDLGAVLSQAEEIAARAHHARLAQSVRHLSHDLHPATLQHAGLLAAVNAHCADVNGQHRLEVTFETEGEFQDIDANAALCVFRVTQEALQNVVRHADARHVVVRLLRTGTTLDLIIVDDGKGFEVTSTRKSGKGLGLVSIRERVRLVGGSAAIGGSTASINQPLSRASKRIRTGTISRCSSLRH